MKITVPEPMHSAMLAVYEYAKQQKKGKRWRNVEIRARYKNAGANVIIEYITIRDDK